MKQFTIIYIPFGREDKEWITIEGNSQEEVMYNFKGGTIISIS